MASVDMRKAAYNRSWLWFSVLVICISVVSDGWSGKPTPFAHQVLLLPITLLATSAFVGLLCRPLGGAPIRITSVLSLLAVFEACSLAMMLAEAHHFRQFGYESVGWQVGVIAVMAGTCGLLIWRRRSGRWLLGGILMVYGFGVAVAVARFPLNYLRSDMLPVITWADDRLLHGLNPYTTMHVGGRLYDFPYLPGMLVMFLPVLSVHWDPRVVNLLYVAGVAGLLFWLATKSAQFAVAASLGAFLLCPFLQYRQDLYLQPHWFFLALAVFLQRRGSNLWAGFAWGISCAIYQLSWVLVPFFLLLQLRVFGWGRAMRVSLAVLSGAAIVVVPFLPVAAGHIAHNTVGQWNHLSHALADPMNLSFWVTYIVPPADLRWIQAAVLLAIFGYCVWRRRCTTQTDMLRWMSGSLALFVALNVLVDGYFYLTVLLLVTMYLCSVNDWWIPEVRTALNRRELLASSNVSSDLR